MASYTGGGSSGPDYVQPGEPANPDALETWYDTDADPDGDGTAQGQYKIYGTDGNWHATSVESHRALRDVLEDSHHTYPVPTGGIADGAVTEAKIASGSLWSTEEIEDLVGSMTGYGLEYDDSQGLISSTRQGPNPYDAAQTFTESDVTVTPSSDAVMDAGSIRISDAGSTADRPADDGSQTIAEARGLEIVPQTDIPGVILTVSSNTGTFSEAVLTDANENILASATGSFSTGDTIVLETPLTSGTTYYVGAYDGGAQFTQGQYTSTASYPYTSQDVHITDGAARMHPDDGFALATGFSMTAFASVSSFIPQTSASATVEWPNDRTDIYEYDVATYTTTPDGGSIDTYVQVNDGSGWTRANGGNPISRNYSLADDNAVSPGDNVRLEFDLSRPDGTHNPTVDSAYVSWVV